MLQEFRRTNEKTPARLLVLPGLLPVGVLLVEIHAGIDAALAARDAVGLAPCREPDRDLVFDLVQFQLAGLVVALDRAGLSGSHECRLSVWLAVDGRPLVDAAGNASIADNERERKAGELLALDPVLVVDLIGIRRRERDPASVHVAEQVAQSHCWRVVRCAVVRGRLHAEQFLLIGWRRFALAVGLALACRFVWSHNASLTVPRLRLARPGYRSACGQCSTPDFWLSIPKMKNFSRGAVYRVAATRNTVTRQETSGKRAGRLSARRTSSAAGGANPHAGCPSSRYGHPSGFAGRFGRGAGRQVRRGVGRVEKS